MYIYPSLLAAKKGSIDAVIKQLDPIAHGYHLDVMDGHFVPNKGLEPSTINDIAKKSSRPLWIHLMVTNPHSFLHQLTVAPGTLITFHYETSDNVDDVIKEIVGKNWQPGLAIKPGTPVEKVFKHLEKLHHVLIMSVEPGSSGSPFLESSLAKIDPLEGYRDTSESTFKIAMDGGIGENNLAKIKAHNVDFCAIGSDIFASSDPARNLQLLNEQAA